MLTTKVPLLHHERRAGLQARRGSTTPRKLVKDVENARVDRDDD